MHLTILTGFMCHGASRSASGEKDPSTGSDSEVCVSPKEGWKIQARAQSKHAFQAEDNLMDSSALVGRHHTSSTIVRPAAYLLFVHEIIQVIAVDP